MKRTHLLLLGIGFGLAVPAASLAQTAYTTKIVNLRAGPSRDYPVVDQLQPGEAVEINGCLDDWTWCDVSVGDDRGWVTARNLDSSYQNRRVVIYGNGPMFGFPIVGFSVGNYWDTYYRGRPWYSRRSYWVGRPQSSHWIGGGSRSGGVRTQVIAPQMNRQPGYRPQVSRQPVGVRPQVGRQPVNRPEVNRQPVNRPQVQRERPQGGRPEAGRPQQPQGARPAPARQPDNRGRPQGKDDRKPGGN